MQNIRGVDRAVTYERLKILLKDRLVFDQHQAYTLAVYDGILKIHMRVSCAYTQGFHPKPLKNTEVIQLFHDPLVWCTDDLDKVEELIDLMFKKIPSVKPGLHKGLTKCLTR